MVSLRAGRNETEVVLLILDDSEPEGQEVFFIYLTDAQGGAQIADSPYQGFGAFAKITILGKSLFELTAKWNVVKNKKYKIQKKILKVFYHCYILLQF